MRSYDGSEGDPTLLGWEGAKDIDAADAAAAWLQRRPDVTDGRIGGIGFSVSGEMMLRAAASNTGLPVSREYEKRVTRFFDRALLGPR